MDVAPMKVEEVHHSADMNAVHEVSATTARHKGARPAVQRLNVWRQAYQ